MAGVNRSNVAVTDTFDTWRIRTNEVNTTLNQATNAITANTIVFRDDDSSYIANAATLNTVSVTHDTTTTALSVTSGLAASADGSKASILTTGGLYATLSSKFAADLTVSTDMTVSGNTIIGSSSGDIVSVNATLSTNVIPTTNVSSSGTGADVTSTGSMLGSTAKHFAHIYNSQQTITAASALTSNIFSITSAAGAGNTATIINNSLTTGTPLTVSSTSTDTTARKLVQITNDAAAAVGTTALSIQSDGGRGIFVDSNLAAGLPSLEIDSEHTTANAVIIDSIMTTGTVIDVTGSALTTGSALRVESTGASTGTRNVVDFRQEHASATGSTVLNVLADEGYGVKITSTAGTSNASLDITSSHTTKNTFNITAASLTTGSAFNILSDSSSTGTRSLASITNDNTGATGTTALAITADAGRGIFVDSNLAAGGYAFEIDSEQESTNVAKIASAATSGTLVELSASGVLTGDVISVTADAATTGKGISVSMDGLTTGGILDISSSSTATNGRSLATITQSGDVTTSGDTTGLKLAMTSGRGLFIDSDDVDGAYAFEIDSQHQTTNTAKIDSAATSGTMLELTASGVLTGKGLNFTADSATTGTGIFMTMDGLTTGKMMDLTSTGTITGNGRILDITADSATTGTGLQMSMDGLTTGKMVDLSSTGTIAGAGRVIDITADSLTTGIGINMSVDALTTGTGLFINSSSTHSGNLVSFVSDGAATGPTLHLRSDATAAGTKIFQVANSSADVFSVTQAGDATIGNDLTISGDFVVTGNLSVSGSTTEINTATTLVRDKTLVLGVKDGGTIPVTFDSHASAPTFTTISGAAHGLSTSDVIFIAVTGSGNNGVTAESLYTVASAANSSVFTLSGTIDTQAGTRTMSFSGPQTDALIDDAGIYLPGSTEIHSFKWDNTDNYWKTSDSLFINDTGQLVLPKGTTAQKPASSATATVPAATTGAVRYNSTNSKIEAVTTGTTYENMSTETFATAIAIALG